MYIVLLALFVDWFFFLFLVGGSRFENSLRFGCLWKFICYLKLALHVYIKQTKQKINTKKTIYWNTWIILHFLLCFHFSLLYIVRSMKTPGGLERTFFFIPMGLMSLWHIQHIHLMLYYSYSLHNKYLKLCRQKKKKKNVWE